MTEKYFVRDEYGYVQTVLDDEPSESELKALCGLADEADLSYFKGTFGFETDQDWCPCGDWDCHPRVYNGGNECEFKKEGL